jgi:hypothetical protein
MLYSINELSLLKKREIQNMVFEIVSSNNKNEDKVKTFVQIKISKLEST